MQYLGLPSPDPATLPPPPRPIRTSKRCRVVRLSFLIVGVIVLVDFLYLGVPSIRRAREMARWPSTEGRILEKKVDDAGDDIGYLLRISFRPVPDGPEVVASSYVTAEQYRTAQPVQRIPVVYDPANPETNCLPFDSRDQAVNVNKWGPETRLFGGFMMLLGLVLIFEWYVQWERRLARDGVLGWGKVLQSGGTEEANAKVEHWIVYEFQPPGSDRTYRHTITGTPEFREQYGKPGSQLAFLYDPAKPKRHKPLVEFRQIEFIGKGLGTS